MSEIKAGDLVVAVRPRACGCVGRIGLPFIAGKISRSGVGGFCTECGADTFGPDAIVTETPRRTWCELSRLKKIDPPATGDEVSTRVTKKQPVSA